MGVRISERFSTVTKPMQTTQSTIAPTALVESADAQVIESLKEQAQRHMPDGPKSITKNLRESSSRYFQKAFRKVDELNSRIAENAAARRQFVEGAR